MKKTIAQITSVILIASVLGTTLLACAAMAEPPYANQMAEAILAAVNEGDLPRYSQHFDQTMKEAVTQGAFDQLYQLIKAKVGDYVSKEFWKVEERGEFTIVHYKAKFTKEPEDVVVRVVFRDTEGKTFVSGLWFDSPELRK